MMRLIILTCLVCGSLCNTFSEFRMGNEQFRTRQDRLLSFETLHNGDINMELAFNVPFITIPVRKSLEMAKGAVANVNIGAVILAGAVAFGISILIPAVLFFVTKKMLVQPSSHSGYKSEDDDFKWQYLNIIDQFLLEHNIDTTSCMQRLICWTVKNSSKNVIKGNSASSSDKIIEGLATSEWLQGVFNGTPVHSALKDGLKIEANNNCSKEYGRCKINYRSLQKFARRVADVINGISK